MMKNIKTYEGFFEFFRKKQQSEDDKIVDIDWIQIWDIKK